MPRTPMNLSASRTSLAAHPVSADTTDECFIALCVHGVRGLILCFWSWRPPLMVSAQQTCELLGRSSREALSSVGWHAGVSDDVGRKS